MGPDEDNVRLLGQATLALWSQLPHDLQGQLFEKAAESQDQQARQKLAKFLHDHHARTWDALAKVRQAPEPDSLGG